MTKEQKEVYETLVSAEAAAKALAAATGDLTKNWENYTDAMLSMGRAQSDRYKNEAKIALEAKKTAYEFEQQKRITEIVARYTAQVARETAIAEGAARRLTAAWNATASAIAAAQNANIDSADRVQGQQAYVDALRDTGDTLAANTARELKLSKIEYQRQMGTVQSIGQAEQLRSAYQKRNELIRQGASLAAEERALTTATTGTAKAAKASNDEFADFLKTLQGFRTDAQQAAAEMDKLELQFQQFGGALNAEELALYAQAMKELKERAEETSDGLEEAAETIGGALGEGLAELALGAKSTKEAFQDMAKSILQEIGKLVAQWATFKIMTGLGFNAGSLGLSNPFAG